MKIFENGALREATVEERAEFLADLIPPDGKLPVQYIPDITSGLEDAVAALEDRVDAAEQAQQEHADNALAHLTAEQVDAGAVGSAGVTAEGLLIDAEGNEIPGGGGPAGPQGPKGDKGDKGDTGATGPQGPQGIQGPAGPQGLRGDAGPAGADGVDGATGPAGADGAVGPAGPQGEPGPAGPQGIEGPAGADGAMGPAGPQGIQGIQGPAGPAGPQGEPGPAGADGADGADGATGPAGPQGIQGPAGATGPQGPQGPQGIQGPAGPAGPAEEFVTAHNTSSTAHADIRSALEDKADADLVALALGSKADLVDGKVPASQLPGYVDDVLEFATLADFPGTGEAGKIYVATSTNKQYRWSGSAYVELVASPGTTDAVPEGTTNLYFTPGRVLDALLGSVSFASNAVISGVDSVRTALGKLQAQVSGIVGSLSGYLTKTEAASTYATIDALENFEPTGLTAGQIILEDGADLFQNSDVEGAFAEVGVALAEIRVDFNTDLSGKEPLSVQVTVSSSRDINGTTDDGNTLLVSSGLTLNIPTGVTGKQGTNYCRCIIDAAGATTLTWASGVSVVNTSGGAQTSPLAVAKYSWALRQKAANSFVIVGV